MRKLDYKPTNEDLRGVVDKILNSYPVIEKLDTTEEVGVASVKLTLKNPIYSYDFTCVWCGKGCSGNISVACGPVCSRDCAHEVIMAR